jgi:hypothetical protein
MRCDEDGVHDPTTNHPAKRWLRERLTTLAVEG